MGRVEQHHDLMVKMTKSRVHFAQLRQVRMQLHRYSHSNSQSDASSVEVNNRVPTNEVRRRTTHSNNNQINDDDDDDDASSNDTDENI